MPSHLAICSCYCTFPGLKNILPCLDFPPTGLPCPSPWNQRMPATTLSSRSTVSGLVSAHAAMSWMSLDECHPYLRTMMCSKRVTSKLRATGLDVWQMECFQDSPGGSQSLQVAAWAS